MKFRQVCMFAVVVSMGLLTLAATRGLAVCVLPDFQSQAMNFTVEGKITKQAPGKLTINSEGNIIFRVVYNDKTEIKRKDGSDASPTDLHVGGQVRVEGELTEAGEVIALKIVLQSARAERR